MYVIYENIITHPIFWVFILMTLAVLAIQNTVAMKVAAPKVDKRWLRQNYVMLILLVATTLAVSATVFYLFEIGISVAGLVNILRDSVNDPTTKPENFRNLGTAVALLMGVLAASATIFFSIIRVWMNERTASAAEEALFNDKINATVSDLHAQRQITKWDTDDKAQTGWEDDVTRRNGAIDRLLGLAKEEPPSAPRIARMLSVYVKELSREYPEKTPPKSEDPKVLRKWAHDLKFTRSDIQNAVQVLGKLRKESGLALEDGEIDLSETNLQGFDLSDLNLEKVSFSKAQLQGANLLRTKLQGAYLLDAEFDAETTLSAARFSYAALSVTDLSETSITQGQLDSAFGDASVTLPGGEGIDDPEWPAHWSKEDLDHSDFRTEWRAFQTKNGYDPDAL